MDYYLVDKIADYCSTKSFYILEIDNSRNGLFLAVFNLVYLKLDEPKVFYNTLGSSILT